MDDSLRRGSVRGPTSLIPGVIYEWTPEGTIRIDTFDDPVAAPDRSEPTRLVAGAEVVPGYRLVKRVGAGCTGEVWSAAGPGGVVVALKFVEVGERGAVQELQSLAWMPAIRHANLISIFGVWERPEWTAIGMDLADTSLLRRFEAATADRISPGIDPAELIDCLRQAARGIDFLNTTRQIRPDQPPVALIHRDIKPANLLLVGGSVKVGDFGLARPLVVDHDGPTPADHDGIESLVTAYSAPEVRRGDLSSRSDQYSLAATYCHLRAGRAPTTPLDAETPVELTMIPPAERPAVAQALAYDPAGRWPDCTSFVEALALAALSSRDNLIPESTVPRSRRPIWSFVTSLLPLILLIVAGTSWWVTGSESGRPAKNHPGLLFPRLPPVPPISRPDRRSLVPDPLVRPTRNPVVSPDSAGVRTAVPVPEFQPVAISASTAAVNAIPPDSDGGPGFSEIGATIRSWSLNVWNQAARWLVAAEHTGRSWVALHSRSASIPPEAPVPAAAEPQETKIIVWLPSSAAELIVRGQIGAGIPEEWYGSRRVIHTPLLTSTRDYIIGTSWIDSAGRSVTQTRTVQIAPGQRYEIDFRSDPPTATATPFTPGQD